MVADGIENCIASIDQFNPSKSVNAFAYFTQIAWNAFIRRILKEQKQTYIKHKNMQQFMLVGNVFETDRDNSSQIQNNELSNGIISNFENKLTKTKKHAKIGIEEFACDTKEDINNEPQ
jgi:DNA-directed RNA polymerase specialized sigma24 family protein